MDNFTKLCRLCTSYQDGSLTLNNCDSDNMTYLNKLNEIAPEILELSNDLPNGICEACIIQLNAAYQFKRKCFASQEILKQYMKQSQNREDSRNSVNEKDSNLENVVECNNFQSFEFIKVETDRFIQESYGFKTKENVIKSKENMLIVKEEPVDYNSECNTVKEFNFNTDNSEIIECNAKTITNDENNLDFEVVDIKSEIIEESRSEIIMDQNKMNETFLTNERIVKSGNISDTTSAKRSYYICQICEESFNNKLDLQLHSRKHKTDTVHNCGICKKVFKYNANLLKHIETHTNETYKCNLCGKVFNQSAVLKRHIRIHSSEKPYTCDICKKAFNQSGNLKIHIRTHTNNKPYSCEICEKSFHRNENLIYHIRTHVNEKPYKCVLCNKGFSNKGNLKIHFRLHTQEKPYSCEICNETFTLRNNLKHHIRTHTQNNEEIRN